MPRKLLKFIILFDNTSLLYFPGQFLSGRVLLELQDETPALGLHFHVIGEAVVQAGSRASSGRSAAFASSSGGSPGRSSAPVAGRASSADGRTYDRENFIDFRMRLLAGSSGQHSDYESRAGASSSASVLSPGIHSFPFKLGLPLGLPSTFLGRFGWIQYYCKAALREPSGLTHKNHQVFIVMNPIDLNKEQRALASPFKCDVEHRLGIARCLGGGGPVRCRVVLDRGGYVPGESIAITALVRNDSPVTLRGTRAALTETIQYLARGRRVQQERRQLAVVARGKIRPGEHDEWLNEQLYVPPLPPTNLHGCHLIRIQYDVFFVIEPKSLEKPIRVQLPIVLATYPFRNAKPADTNGSNAADGHYPDQADDDSRRSPSNNWPDAILKPDTHYPSTLPIFRPWLHDKADHS